MSTYLVKTSNFVAEISSDEELIHLATVGTIQTSTLINDKAENRWKRASEFRILQKIWGIEKLPDMPKLSTKKTNTKAPEAKNTANFLEGIKPIDSKALPPPSPKGRPPRLDTVVDFAPQRFSQLLSQLQQAEELEGVEPPPPPQPSESSAQSNTHNTLVGIALSDPSDDAETLQEEPQDMTVVKPSPQNLEEGNPEENANNEKKWEESDNHSNNNENIGEVTEDITRSDHTLDIISSQVMPLVTENAKQTTYTLDLTTTATDHPRIQNLRTNYKDDDVQQILQAQFASQDDKDFDDEVSELLHVFKPEAFGNESTPQNAPKTETNNEQHVLNLTEPLSKMSSGILDVVEQLQTATSGSYKVSAYEKNAELSLDSEEDTAKQPLDKTNVLIEASGADNISKSADSRSPSVEVIVKSERETENNEPAEDLEDQIRTMPISAKDLGIGIARPNDETHILSSEQQIIPSFAKEETVALANNKISGIDLAPIPSPTNEEAQTKAIPRDSILPQQVQAAQESRSPSFSFTDIEAVPDSVCQQNDNPAGISFTKAQAALNKMSLEISNNVDPEDDPFEDQQTREMPSVRQQLRELIETTTELTAEQLQTREKLQNLASYADEISLRSTKQTQTNPETEDDDDHPSEQFSRHSRSELEKLVSLDPQNLEELDDTKQKTPPKKDTEPKLDEENTKEQNDVVQLFPQPLHSKRGSAGENDETLLEIQVITGKHRIGESAGVPIIKVPHKKVTRNKRSNSSKISEDNSNSKQASKKKSILHEQTFSGRLFEGELEVARFQNMCLTTHRLWRSTRVSGHLKSYESYNLSAIQWVRLNSEKRAVWLVLCILVLVGMVAMLLPNFVPSLGIEPIVESGVIVAIGVWGMLMFTIGYFLMPRSVIQIGLASEKIDIPTSNGEREKEAALEFLNKIDSACHKENR